MCLTVVLFTVFKNAPFFQSEKRSGPFFMSQKRARESVTICNFVNTIVKPKSTEYLATYTRGDNDRRVSIPIDLSSQIPTCNNEK